MPGDCRGCFAASGRQRHEGGPAHRLELVELNELSSVAVRPDMMLQDQAARSVIAGTESASRFVTTLRFRSLSTASKM